MKTCVTTLCWLGVISGLGAIAISVNDRAIAQIVPDASLGAERSVVTPNTVIRGVPSDRIDGGAIRGSNLFHSFQQFSIGEGRGAYFANPAGIENILSRVIGNSRSEILGKLGVLGNANLFLLNPNGIVFGPNASLDVAGSFTATTANAIALGDQGFFSATQPDKSSLLAIAPGALFFDQQVRQPKTIQNSGNLTAGRDLTLAADNLELQGQLRSGGNLTLQAQDTLRIRDSVTAPFIASAGGSLLVQGDRSVDIFALNHPDSGLFSGGDMVLRSANTIGGDAHYTAGGSFKLEQLNGGIGNLASFYDPIVLANGNVIIGDYTGPSLHVLAGGSVGLGNVVITGVDGIGTTINPTSYPFLANVTLPNGQPLPIDGSSRPTLDVRAGINWVTLPGNQSDPPGFPGFQPGNPLFLPGDGAANIIALNIKANQPNSLVYLTNRFLRNPALLQGDVAIANIDTTTATGEAGDVVVDASGNIATAEIKSYVGATGTGKAGNISLFSASGGIDTTLGTLNASTTIGLGGNISLQAAGNIRTADVKTFVGKGGSGFSGDITLVSQKGSIDTRAGTLESSTDNGFGGKIALRAAGDIFTASINSFTNGTGDAGDVSIDSGGRFILSNNTIFSKTFGSGKGGKISIKAESVSLTNLAFLISNTEGTQAGAGRSGDIRIEAQSLFMNGGSEVLAQTLGTGKAGNITVIVPGTITLSGSAPFPVVLVDNKPYLGGFSTGLIASTERTATNQGGTIDVTAGTLRIEQGAVISTRSRGSGNVVDPATPDAKSIKIDVDRLEIDSGGQILTTGFKAGRAGGIDIQSTGDIFISGEDVGFNARRTALINFLLTPQGRTFLINGGVSLDEAGAEELARTALDPTGAKSGLQAQSNTGSGNITVNSTNGSIFVSKTAEVDSSIYGKGSLAGSIDFQAPNGSVSFDNARVFSTVESGAVNSVAGGIGVSGKSIALTNGAQLQTLIRKDASGSAGIILMLATDAIAASGDGTRVSSSIEAGATGSINGDTNLLGLNRGAVLLGANNILFSEGAVIDVATKGRGDAGIAVLAANDTVSFTGELTSIFSTVEQGAVGNAGGIGIQARSLVLSDGANLQALTRGDGSAGVIQINASGSVELSGTSPSLGFSTGIFTSTEDTAIKGENDPQGGDIQIMTGTLRVLDGAVLSARTRNEFKGGSISVATNTLEVRDGGQILTTASGNASGFAGDIAIGASGDIVLSGRDPNFSARQSLASSAESQFLLKRGAIFDNVENGSSGLFANTEGGTTAQGGNIRVSARNLSILNNAQISVDAQSTTKKAGNIKVTVDGFISLDKKGEIQATTLSGNGGNITIGAQKYLLLRRDSNISTTAGKKPAGGDGGNITIDTPFIIAAPSRNSNITAQAYTGSGGVITINGTALFNIAPRSDDFPTSNDITTSSRFGLAGTTSVNALDGSFLENSLTEFPQNLIDPNALLANSCIVRNRGQNRGQGGTFLVTGSGGLPVRPSDPPPSPFPTGEVRSLPEAGNREQETENRQSWQPGDPIMEPQGIYRLANGRLIMSRECEP